MHLNYVFFTKTILGNLTQKTQLYNIVNRHTWWILREKNYFIFWMPIRELSEYNIKSYYSMSKIVTKTVLFVTEQIFSYLIMNLNTINSLYIKI